MNRYDEPGRGRKLCKGCSKYVPVATRICICGESFEYGKVIVEKQKQEKIEEETNKRKDEEKENIQTNTTTEEIYAEDQPQGLSKLSIELELHNKINALNIALLKKQNKIEWNSKIEEELKNSFRSVILTISGYFDLDNIESIKNWFILKKIYVKHEDFEVLGKTIQDSDLLIISFLKDFPKIKNISWKWKNNDEDFLISFKNSFDYKILLLRERSKRQPNRHAVKSSGGGVPT